MTSKPTGSGASETEAPAAEADPRADAAVSPLGTVPLEPREGLDFTDRQNLMDTHATAPRRPGDPDASIGSLSTLPTAPGTARARPANETPPTVEDAKPGDPPDDPDEADVQAPDGWFRTEPPNDPRAESPEPPRPVDPVIYVLAAVALGVIVVMGGFVWFG